MKLTKWLKLTLPVNASGKPSGDPLEISQPELETYQSEFLAHSYDGTIRLFCPYNGAKTPTAKYTRCEFRGAME